MEGGNIFNSRTAVPQVVWDRYRVSGDLSEYLVNWIDQFGSFELICGPEFDDVISNVLLIRSFKVE